MRQGLKGLCGVGMMALPLAVAIAQQPVVEDLTGRSGSFYDQTATRSESGGSLVLFNQVQQHQEELRQLRGQVEELRYQLEQLKRQTRQQYMDLDERLTHIGERSGSGSGPAPTPSTEETPDTSIPAPDREQAPSSAGADGSARQAYQAAFAEVQAREFAAATTAFETFVAEHPDSPLTSNAYYWLGELHSAESELEAAEDAFQRVLDDYPDSGKVPDTLYKLGLLKIRQGEPDAGRALLERVIDDHPESSAANLAGDYLRQSGN